MKHEHVGVILFGLINAASIIFWDAQIGTVVAIYLLHIAVSGVGILVQSYASTRSAIRHGTPTPRPWNNFFAGAAGLTILLGLIGMTAGIIFTSKGADVFTGERAPDLALVAIAFIPAFIGVIASTIRRRGSIELPTEHETMRPIVYLAIGSIPVLVLLQFSDAIAEGGYRSALIAYVVAKALIDSFLIKVKGVHGA